MKNLIIVLALMFGSTAFADSEQICIDKSVSIEDKISCISGLTVLNTSAYDSKKVFEIRIKQPLDHSQPQQNMFDQRLVLIHKSENEPMILQTSGYKIFGVNEDSLTRRYGANQIQVEHRFFADSVPSLLDWSKLDIKQSADDFHAITVAFQKIYKKPWVNTGASKGGMTSVYHRYFYPDDLAGTVADVAPLSFSTADSRYPTFIDNVGGETRRDCRENLKKLQQQLLENRDALVPQIAGKFTQLGGRDVAFEHAVLEATFYFWQYGYPDDPKSGCDGIPKNGTPAEAFKFLERHAQLDGYTDASIGQFLPYYFQAATQLGNPGVGTDHVAKLLKHAFSIDQYTPKNVQYIYSNKKMHDVESWVRTSADDIIFVYGEFDPWTAGEFPVSETGKNISKFYVPGGNHSSDFTELEGEDQVSFHKVVSSWLGKQPTLELNTYLKKPSLGDLEFEARKRHRL